MTMKKLCSLLAVCVMALSACACSAGAGSGDSESEGGSVSSGRTEITEKEEISLDDEAFILWYGRTEAYKDGSVGFDYTASGFEVKFRGSRLEMNFTSTEYADEIRRVCLTVITDGEDYRTAPVYALDEENKTLVVEAEEGEHAVRVLKRSEASQSRVRLASLSSDGVFLRADERSERFIEIYGDSITCGYGNVDSVQTDDFSTRTEDGLATYGFIAAQTLGAECSILAGSGMAVCRNIWGSELKIPDLLARRSYYDPSEYESGRIPQVVVINGGANDNTYISQAAGAEKEARKRAFIEAYAAFLSALRARYPGVKIICCTNMLNEGETMEYLIGLAINEAGYDEDLVLLSLPSYVGDGVGASGHPTYITHEKAAEALANKIKEEMDW